MNPTHALIAITRHSPTPVLIGTYPTPAARNRAEAIERELQETLGEGEVVRFALNRERSAR